MKQLIGVDGPDGSGKSSLAKRLAEETGSQYRYFSQDNLLSHLRGQADQLSSEERFLFYLSMSLMSHPQLSELKARGNKTIILDRTPLSTFAYHEVMGVNVNPFRNVQHYLLEQFDQICYVYASTEVRRARILSRLNTGQMHKFDEFSLKFDEELNKAFLSILPENAIIIDTSALDIDSAVRETHTNLAIKGFFDYE